MTIQFARIPLFATLMTAALIYSAPAFSQEYIFLPPFETNSSGTITGTVTEAGLENSIEVLSFQHELFNEVNAKSGSTGITTQHSVVTITKELDRATPFLVDTLVKNGTIFSLTFLFFRTDPLGEKFESFSITLEEAQVSHIRHEKPDDRQSRTREYVSFSYDKITWEAMPFGFLAFDSWQQTRRAR